MVFNASMKTTNGITLNETQLVGPRIQDNLMDIISRFRRFCVAFTADIEKMYRQVRVDPRQRKWQRILWRDDPEEDIGIYELSTITYGLASSPFCAIRTLRQCALDNFNTVPDNERAIAARDSILDSFYVDDFLESAESTQAAITMAEDIDHILRQGKFVLRKWKSNEPSVLKAMVPGLSPPEEVEISDPTTTVLGLHWNPVSDSFVYRVALDEMAIRPSKRIVASDVGRLYDPVGFLAPVLITAKIFIQSLWKAQLTWDEPLPEELREEWLAFRCTVFQVRKIKIPRWLGMAVDRRIDYHGYCDASKRAFAAVIYVRCVSDSDPLNPVTVALVSAKTAVAPVKESTIPRLELSAAQLLIKLWLQICQSLRCDPSACSFYSDSMIVLSWIKRSPGQWREYVSNRVKYIQQHSAPDRWYPAYHPRGQLVEPSPEEINIIATEERPIRSLVTVTTSTLLCTWSPKKERIPLVDRFSCLIRLLHTTARVFRMSPTYRQFRNSPFITVEESDNALRCHLRQAQAEYLGQELRQLQNGKQIGNQNPLLPLNPIVDEQGLIRVGGRLGLADLSYGRRHPWIIPHASALCGLIIAQAHVMTIHGGIQQMLQYIRKRFWIIKLRALVKTHIHRCLPCKLHQRTMHQQQMASLPKSRVAARPPFLSTGVDYCGPFNVRLGGPRSRTTVKTYGVIFVCMTTKAVHIELAEDLSTQGFLDVFDRFISRRGICSEMFSDNGTQFHGAARQMHRDLVQWRESKALQHLADLGVSWQFITPAAPHHGGLWEAAVRSVKTHLVKVVGQEVMSFNSLSNLLVRIEACLNSRPIVALHDDISGGMALTPGDFLIGRPINSRPEIYPDDAVPKNRLAQHERLKIMLKRVWSLWERDYLTQLQARSKWLRPHPNICPDDVVAIKDENLPPTYWTIGRVVETHPGRDGLVRTATVAYNSRRTNSHGLFEPHMTKRPVQKLCRLMSAEEDMRIEGAVGVVPISGHHPDPAGQRGEDV